MSGWDEAQVAPPQVVSAPAETEGESTRYTGVSLTLKADGAYDAPWYVIHGRNAGDVLAQLRDPRLFELLNEVTKQSVGWSLHQAKAKGLEPVPQQAGGQRQNGAVQQQATQQQAASSRPNEPAPQCPHGEREWRDFTSRAGNHVKGWFCTVKNSDCKALYRN